MNINGHFTFLFQGYLLLAVEGIYTWQQGWPATCVTQALKWQFREEETHFEASNWNTRHFIYNISASHLILFYIIHLVSEIKKPTST